MLLPPAPPDGARDAFPAAALLLDLDGTLVDTAAAVEASWRRAAVDLRVPFSRLAPYIHGIPAAAALALALPELPDERRAAVAQEIHDRVIGNGALIRPLPGVPSLLATLPEQRWAIVTSGDRRMAMASIGKAGVPMPAVLVTSDDVHRGKPDPEPFLTAARALGVAPRACVVVEDSPAGVAAGLAAGMHVIGLTTTHGPDDLAGADWVVPDLRSLAVAAAPGGLVVGRRAAPASDAVG